MILLSFHFDITVNNITVNLYSCVVLLLKLYAISNSHICRHFHIQQRSLPLFLLLPPSKAVTKTRDPHRIRWTLYSPHYFITTPPHPLLFYPTPTPWYKQWTVPKETRVQADNLGFVKYRVYKFLGGVFCGNTLKKLVNFLYYK